MNNETSPIVLYAEDDENDSFFMQRAFKKVEGYKSLHIVCNGAEAISYLSGKGKYASREDYPYPTIIFLDIKMPITSGLEVLAWIRKNRGTDPPVFMLSSSSQSRDFRDAIDLGANGYLLKPADAGRLTNVLSFIRNFCIGKTNSRNGWVQFEGDKLVETKRPVVSGNSQTSTEKNA